MKTETIKSDWLPRHVGIIMDGNRRWAKLKGLPQFKGHRQGLDNLTKIIEHALKLGIGCLTFYTFSAENWKRSKTEVGYLLNLFRGYLNKLITEMEGRGVSLRFLGKLEKFPADIQKMAVEAEARTRHNGAMKLNFAFNYGGQEELVEAFKKLSRDKLKADDINIEAIRQRLYGPELPDVDLVIRTSGEQRTSGFMLWQAAYAELYFTEKFWPDFRPRDFDQALEWFAERERRFGK